MITPCITLTKQSGFGRGKAIVVEAEEVSFGTASHHHVQFDPTWDKTVDQTHGLLIVENGKLVLQNKSKQGSFIEGRLVTREVIQSGAVVELGKGGPRVLVEYEIPVVSSVSPPAAARVEPQPVDVQSRAEPYSAVVNAAAPGGGKKFPVAMVAGIAVGLMVLGGAIYMATRLGGDKPSGDTGAAAGQAETAAFVEGMVDNDTKFSRIINEYKEAVAVVVYGLKPEHGGPRPNATAWAIGEHTYATNSHVTEGVEKMLEKGIPVYLATNQNPDKRLKVLRAVHHPRYNKREFNFEGRKPAISLGDVGLLITEEKAPKVFKVAPQEELKKLKSGYAICFIGFPMEGLVGGGVDPRNPVATMQSGIITSVTDHWLSRSTFPKRLLISHNMGATGGASGSPLINTEGEVVGILSAGNIVNQPVRTSMGEVEIHRAPNAAMINFGQRIDQLKDIYKGYPVK